MKTCLKKITFYSMLFLSCHSAYSSTPPTTLCPVSPFYSIRSQGVDIADELVGWTDAINRYDMDKIYGSIAIKPKYTRTFRENTIAQSLIGVAQCDDQCGGRLTVSGSRVANRGATDLLADNFYLPTDYQSSIRFNPRIDNFLFDMNFYLGFDEWVPGLFFRLHLPITYSRWSLNFCETIINAGQNAADEGYLGCDSINRANLLPDFASYAQGGTPGVPSTSIPAVYNGLAFARFDRCNHGIGGVAELRMIAGYNFLNCENYHLGVGLLAAAPTGTRPDGRRLFEPIVGNGHHWELGMHLTSHWTLWRACDEQSSLGIYVDANVTHMFNARQRRTFDLCGKPLSRYMLAMRMTSSVTNGLNGEDNGTFTAPTVQFSNQFMPLANITTQEVKVSAFIQADVAAQCTYTMLGFSWDMGYNFWGRSCEKIKPVCPKNCTLFTNGCGTTASTTSFAESGFVLKGDAYAYGASSLNDSCVPLAVSESQATIFAGTNFPATGASNNMLVDAGRVNPNVDNEQLAFLNTSDGQIPVLSPPLSNGSPAQTNISVNPLFIKALDFNACRGTKGISHKLYGNVSYQWIECEDWVPFLGIGGFAEFGNSLASNAQCATTCKPTQCSCKNYALSQWGVWIKSGMSFN